MITAPGEWPVTAAHVSVVGLTHYYVLHAEADELDHVLSFAASHHLELNLALDALPAEECGRGIEGVVHKPSEAMLSVDKLKQLGAKITSISLDEPLTFGFGYRGNNQCAFSIAEVARRLATTIHAVRGAYPNAKIVDYEAGTDHPTAEWLTILAEWLSAYQAATGTPLDALGLDMNWHKPYWIVESAATVNFLHDHGIKAEFFINAQGDAHMTDAAWLSLNQHNMQEIWRARIPFDGVIFAIWNARPTRLLPESDPFSLTGLMAWYFGRRP